MDDPLNGWSPLASYFGDPWPSEVCEQGERVATPVGRACLLCETPILAGQQGSVLQAYSRARGRMEFEPVHRECLLRQMAGSVEHLEGRCRCHPPQGLGAAGVVPQETFREQALATWRWLEVRRFRIPTPAARPDA